MVSRVYFATNRSPAGDGSGYGSDVPPGQGAELSLGLAQVALTETRAGLPDNKRAHAEQVEKIATFERTQVDDARRPAGTARLVSALRKSVLDRGRDLIIYIHGDDTSFAEAVWYGAQIKLQYSRLLKANAEDIRRTGGWPGTGMEVLVLSWPSDGGDRASPSETRRILDRGWHLAATRLLTELEEIVAQQRAQAATILARGSLGSLEQRLYDGTLVLPGKLHLMAQSMGARILAEGLGAYVTRRRAAGQILPLLQSAILTGADIDATAFEAPPLSRLVQIAQRVTVYHNRADRLGLLSALMWGKARMSRKGLADPGAAPAVTDVDVSAVAGGEADPFGQHYARMSDPVIRDLLYVMADAPAHAIPGRVTEGYRNAVRLEPVEPDP